MGRQCTPSTRHLSSLSHFLAVLCHLIYSSNNKLSLFTNTVHGVVQVGLAGYQSLTLGLACVHRDIGSINCTPCFVSCCLYSVMVANTTTIRSTQYLVEPMHKYCT